MASPVDTSVKFFHSNMVNASTLNGVAGSLLSILDACLVDGFDLKNATSLVVAGGIATLSFSGTHSAEKDSVILVSGSSISALNGEQKVLNKTATAVTFTTAAADGAASGTITFKMAPLGWTKQFSGTNVAVYKSSAVDALGHMLRVDDTGTTFARVVGYESMSDVNSGTGQFPTAAQVAGGGYWTKSSAANATANRWFVAGDSKFFMIHFCPYLGAGTVFQGVTRGFGDIIAYRSSGDAFACVLNYSNTSSLANQYLEGFDSANNATGVASAMPRGYTGIGGAALFSCYPFVGLTSAISGADVTLGTFPSYIDGTLRLSKKFFALTASGDPPRGELPGLHHCSQSGTSLTFPFGTRTTGSGQLNGRNLFSLNPAGTWGAAITIGNTGASFVDVTGPWR